MEVDVYWNLHRKCFSVRDRSTGRVVRHLNEVTLTFVDFVVQPAGREKVRREGRKTVHAFMRGELAGDASHWLNQDTGATITYNPYVDETFVAKRGDLREPVSGALVVRGFALTTGPKVYAFRVREAA